MVKATGAPLAQHIRHAEKAVVNATAALDNHRQAAVAYRSSPRRPPGRPPAFEQRITDAHQAVVEAEVDLDEARERRAAAQEQVREISAAYHPYHLETGQAQSVEDVSHRLETCWERLNELDHDADLPERCLKKLCKARRVTDELLATVGFFFATLQAKIEALIMLGTGRPNASWPLSSLYTTITSGARMASLPLNASLAEGLLLFSIHC